MQLGGAIRKFLTGRQAGYLGLLFALALAGCAGTSRPLTPEEFYGFCWPTQIDTDCGDDSLCQTFKNYLLEEHASRRECIAGCRQLQAEAYRRNVINGCSQAVRHAGSWCEIYCNRHFGSAPAPQPQPPGQP